MTEDRGRQLILADGKHSAEEERQAIQYLLDSRRDGVIIYPCFSASRRSTSSSSSTPSPSLVLNRRLRRYPAHCVYSDQQAAAAAVVERLVGRGTATSPSSQARRISPTGMERLAGYREALSRHDIPVQEVLIAPGKWTPPAARPPSRPCWRAG